MLHALWFIIVGFFAGLIARAVLPGVDQMGFFATTAVGIVGAVIGGFVGRLFNKPKEGAKFHPAGIIMSIVGAIVVLLAMRWLQ